jgi:hypothetical protein
MFLAVQTTCSQTTTWRKRERSPDFADEYCDVDEFFLADRRSPRSVPGPIPMIDTTTIGYGILRL